jgi:hypothetical protein
VPEDTCPARWPGGGVFAECDVLDVVICLDGPMPAGEPGQVRRELARRAHLGTVNDVLNVPVDEIAAVASSVVLKSTVTVSLTPNPEPRHAHLVAGGPDVGFMILLAVPWPPGP